MLGGFEQLPLTLPDDEEGTVVATLVRPTAAKTASWGREPHGFAHGIDVLYVHGWSDYFFQAEHALFWTRAGARLGTRAALPAVDPGFNTQASSRLFDGEWDYDLQWRPERGFPVHSAWLDAVLDGHARVAEGLDIGVPVLVMLSSRSWLQPSWSPRIYDSDVALDVDGVAERATRLGRHVSVVRIDGALHDVLLSRRSVRASAYDVMARWTRAYLPETASVDRLLRSLRG